eukprot:XP_001701822.1 centriole proteome protein [Chlamydomonas reinhardtii]
MLRFTAPPRVTICGPGGSIWVTKPVPGVAGLVSVLQVPASKYSEAVRGPDFAVVALDQSGTLLLTIDTRGSLYSYQLRHNRFSCLDKAQSAGTAALFAGPRLVFAAFSDGSLRVYDISKSALVAMFREHRSPVRHLALSRELDELLSTSVDGVMVWDIKQRKLSRLQKLRRKRVLGSGPYGAVQASYTPDGLAIVTQFKDGSFYVWAAGNFTLLRSFTLPLGPALRPAQSAFALSPDGQWLVACGAGLPLLLLYSIIGGELLYGVGLPAPPTALDQAAAGQAADAAAAAAAAAEGHAGAAQLPPAGHLEGPAAATALAATLPMAVGATQVRFLPDSATVAALLTDGSVAFVDVLGCQAVGSVPYTFPNRQDCMFDADERVEQMALVANGKVMLYDLEATRTNVQPPRPLPRVLPAQLDDLAAAVALQSLQRQQAPEEQQHKAQATAQPVRQVEQARDAERAGGMARDTQRAQDTQRASQGKVATSGLTAAAGKRKAGAPAVAAGVALDRSRLESLLEAFGEYPAKYRLLIWDYLLQLPHNTSAFSALAGLGAHPAFKDLPAQLGLPSRAMAQRLASTLSQLAHWCPVFAESSFLPDLVFPFVKLFASSPGPLGTADGGAVLSAAALDERCFETLATLIAGGWLRGWWERFPHPPLGLLTRLQDLLGLHDAPVAAHFSACRGGFAAVVWPHLATLWTELLSRGDWMRLWDHCITAGPDLLYFFIAAYWVSLRSGLLACDTDHKLANWLAGPPPVDVGKVLRTAYLLRERTPAELRPVPAEWQPLPPGPTYTDFKGFPEAAVEVFSADRKRIRDAEDAIMRRRAVVSELELRTRAVALQAASLSTERQQLAALEEERRGLLRQLEAETAAELARLDDRAKEEKLKQVAAVERAYQANLLEVRATWQRELESVRAEVAHKRALAAQQVRSREEDEQIKKLEFHAQQRMWELEEDTRRAALAAAVRDELGAQQAEMEAKQRVKLKEWETDEEARRLRFQAEAARRSEVAATAEAAAARNAAAREVLSMTLEAEDQLVKLDGQRRLRRLTEEAALVTAEARAAEEARAAARAKAEREAVQIRAAADLAWFEAEQLRREQLLEEERQQMQAMADAAREKLADTEAAARTMAAQAELLERRRHLERQNVEEEAQVRRLLGAMAAERARDAGLVVTLEAKQEEMKAKLEHAARVGSLQREVESSEAAAAAALRAQLSEQQRLELAELRRQHEAAMQQLAGEREGQAAEAAARLRAQLQAQQAAEVRDMTSTFERSLADMERELLLEQVRLARSAAAAAASSGQHTSQTSYSTSAAAASSSNTTSATTSAAATSQAAASTAGAGAGGVGGRDAAQSRPAPNGAPGSAVGGHAAGGTAAAARPQTGPSGSAANLLSRLLAVETPTRTSVMSESDYTPGSLPSTTATATPSPSPLPDAVLGRRSAIGATAATLGGAASGLARRAGAPPQPKGHPPRFGLPLTAAATAQAADREAEPRQRSGSTSTGPTSGATSGSNTRGSSGNGSGVGDDANGEGAVYALRRAGVSESSGLTATVRARDVGEATGPVAGAIGDGWLSQAARVQAALFPTTPATVSGSTTSAYTAPSSILPASSPASSASMYLPGPGPLDRSTEAATAAAAAVGSAGRAALAVLEAVSPERPTPGRESWEARSTGRGGSPSSLSGALRRLGLGDDMSELSTGATSAGATVTAAQAGGGDVDMSVAVTPGLSPGQYGSGGSMSSLDTTPLPSRTTRTDAGAGAVSGASSGAPSASFSGSGSGASRGSGGDSGPGATPAGSAGSARNDETASVAGSSAGSGARSGSRAIASAAEAGADATAPSPGLTESQLPSPGPSLGPDLSPGLASTVTLGVSPLAPGSAYSPSAASYPYQSRQSMVRGSPARSPGVSESGRPSLLQTYSSGGAGLPSLPGGDLDMYSAGLAADFAASTRLAMAMTEAESEAARRQQQQQQQAARSARPSSSSGVAAGGAASAVSPSPDVAELLRRLRLAVEESPARPLQPPAAQAPAQPPRLRHQEAAASPALLPPHAGDRHGAGGGGPAPWSAHPSPAPMGFGSRVESAAGSASDLSQHVERSGSGGGSGNGSGDERAALEPARLAAAAPYGASSAPYRAPSPPRGAPTGSLGPSPLSRARGSGGGSEAPHYMKTWYPGSPAPADSHSLLPSSTATPQHAGDAAGAGGSSAGDQTGDLSALLRGLGGASAPLSDLETSPGGDTYTHTYTDMDLLYGHAADVDSLLYTGSAAGGAGETGFTPGSTFRTDADETATLEELGEEIEEIQL